MSDDGDDTPAKPPIPTPHSDDDHRWSKRKRKQMKLIDEEDEEEQSNREFYNTNFIRRLFDQHILQVSCHSLIS